MHKRTSGRLFPLFLAASTVLWHAPQAPAQSTFGGIVGTILDATGAAVADVVVEARNLEENTTRSTVSNSQGLYQILNLKPGKYELLAKKPGFAVAKVPSVDLDARQTLRADMTLDVANMQQTVSVEAAAATVNTENGTIGDSKNFAQVTQLPVNYRGGTTSPLAAIATVPGVQQDNAGNYSIGGGLPSMIEFTVDGVSTVNIRSNGALSDMYPSSELIREFKVTAVNNNAEFAQVGDVTVSTKSGTNTLHGSGFEYHQNRALDATTYGSNTKQAKVFNTFGGSLGGPIYIPKLYKGKDKTFFFVAYEGNRRPGSTSLQYSVPTTSLKSGNLAGLPGQSVVDPTSGAPFPNSIIPASRLSPVAQKLLSGYYPDPNFNSGSAFNNYRTLVGTPSDTNGLDMRFDHTINSKQQIYGRYSWKKLTSITANNLLPSDTTEQINKNLIISHNYSLKPNVINEFRFGISHWTRQQIFPINGTKALADLGIVGLNTSNHPDTGAFPGIDFSDGTSYTTIGHAKDGARKSITYQYTDNLSWVKGSHTMKFGFDIRKMKYIDVQYFGGSDDFGQFTFNGGAFTGNAFGDLLLGLPSTTYFSITGPDLDSPVGHYRFYGQDEWRVNSRLTISYGLRWQIHPPFTEANGNITNFDRTNGNVIIPVGALAPAPGFLASINACGPSAVATLPCAKIVTNKDAGLGLGLRKTYYGNLAPRFSVAYRPFGDNKTVFRGGFGVFTMTALGPLAYALTGIHTSDTRTFTNFTSKGTAPLYAWPQAFAGNLSLDAAGTGEFIVGTQTDYRDPNSVQWNATVERELPKDMSLRVSYIGMNSSRLNSTIDLNSVPASTTPYSASRRPFTNWGRILSRDNIGFSNYQSMQMEVNRRMTRGLFFQGSYNLAKNLGNINADVPTAFAGESGGTLADRFNTRLIRGNIVGTRRHRGLVSAIYQLPFGKGRPFLANMNPISQAIIGGWEISTVTMLQSGPWLTPTMSRGSDKSNMNVVGRGVNVRPDRIGNGNLDNPTPDRWFDINSFVVPAAGVGREGNSGVGILEGPGTVAIAGGMAKTFLFKERMRVRLEGTFTNLPNHPNFAPPGTNISTPVSFGRTTSVQASENSGNRVGQVALRIEF